MYTKYHVSLKHKLDYTDTASLSVWMEPYRQPVLVNLNFELRQHEQIAATGKLENCVFSLQRQRPLRLSAIGFPDGVPEDVPNSIPDFVRLDRSTEGMEERYRRTVRMSDLDKSNHMTNLRYIDMYLDAYDSTFWKAFEPRAMEISFLSQCREEAELTVLSRAENDAIYLAAVHADGSPASMAMFSQSC